MRFFLQTQNGALQIVDKFVEFGHADVFGFFDELKKLATGSGKQGAVGLGRRVFAGRKCAEFAVVILLPVLQAMAFAIVTPTRNPVKEPGPLTTKTFLISCQLFLFFFNSAARFGKIF